MYALQAFGNFKVRVRMPDRAFGLICCLILASFTTLPAHAQDDQIFPAEAAIPNSRVIRFTSVIDKEPYEIQVSIPLWPATKGGYPVIYVLDGDVYFPTAAIQSDVLLTKNAAVVVGVGHGALNDRAVYDRYAPGEHGRPMFAAGVLRNHDFKWPAKPEHRAPDFMEDQPGNGDSGDLDSFLQVIEKEIKPKVEALVPIDRNNQAIWGWSLGGLAVVRALFTEPEAFRSFIATSPSLWYDGGAILDGEKRFADEVTAKYIAPRVLITNGALEADSVALSQSYIDSLARPQRAEAASYSKMRSTWPSMIGGARDLAARLASLNGQPGYKVEYQLIPDENHMGSAFVAVGRAVKFALGN